MSKKNILIINLFIAIISIVFTFCVINMVYENKCRELNELYVKFMAKNLAEKVETSVRLGMDIDNYYGMSDILREAVSYDENNIDAVFINTEGNPKAYTFGDDENKKLALVLSRSLKNLLNGKEEITNIGNERVLIEPVSSEKGFAYILIMYDKNLFTKMESLNIINEYKRNVNSVLYCTFGSVKSTLYSLYSKGLKGQDIEKLSKFYNEKFSKFGLIKSIEIGYDTGKNNEYSIYGNVFEDDTGKFGLVLNINEKYVRNIYIQTIMTFVASFSVCIMIIVEISSLGKITKKSNNRKDEDDIYCKSNISSIVKFFTFFVYLAVYAVLPYGAVIIRRSGESILGLPLSFTASLPVSLNCMGIFIMLLLGDRILKKININSYIIITMLSGIISMIMCLFNMNTHFILISSFLMGVCLGMEKYIMNYLISICSDSDSEIKINYGYYNGGLLSGLALGGSVGGIISSARGYEHVYFAGCTIMVVLLPVLLYYTPFDYVKNRQNKYTFENKDKTKSFCGFVREIIKRPRLALDFAAACIPLNMGLMFIVSFLPVLLDVNEMSSLVNTFSYILYGVAGNYIGIYLIKKLKHKRENVSGFISMAVIALSVFVLIPKVCLVSILVSATLAGLFDGYGGAVLTSIPVNSKNAEGIDKSVLLTGTSVTGSIICTLSPVIYSGILNMGSISVNLIVMFLFFGISGIYILTNKSL